MPEFYGKIVLCKMCGLKIMSPMWRTKSYNNNDEINRQKESVINSARKNRFNEAVIEGLSNFFESKIIPGLCKIVDGGNGQIITVCEDHCIIKTNDNFNYKETNKAYIKMMSGNRDKSGLADYISPEFATSIINGVVGSIVPGGGILKKVIKQLVQNVAVNKIIGTQNDVRNSHKQYPH